jgi:uncharacterized protein (DUF433 family)
MDRPTTILSPHEAAALAGISERDMHRAIDEEIVPENLVQVRGKRRGFTPAACVLMAYYIGLADKLTAKQRKRTIREAAASVAQKVPETVDPTAGWGPAPSSAAPPEDRALTAELEPFVARVRERLARLEAARSIVTSSPDILDGTPVVRNTRVPVHAVAGTYADEGADGAQAAYPDLDWETIELAKLYADTHPPRGRPRTRAVPNGARAVRTWHKDRRTPERTSRRRP